MAYNGFGNYPSLAVQQQQKAAAAPAPTNNYIIPNLVRPVFTPNQYTQSQLGEIQQQQQMTSGANNMSTPQWMMDAYINKIGSMGGNANAPIPFQVNQSGFPGMGGKTAPTQG
jgi:hypothetical protein